MSTVVGLVKSRLRSRSRRDKSIDGSDVLVDNGNGLVRYRSLRQEALADPTMDDVSVLDPVAQPRTPNDVDPASLADGLQGVTLDDRVPPVPSLPTDLPRDYFPTRQSSLQSRRQYAIRSHRRASSHTKDDGLRLNVLPEDAPRRRHYTISSPDERPHFGTGDYFQPMPQHSAQVESPIEVTNDDSNDSAQMPTTRTAKLFGSIAEKRRSTDLKLESDRRSSRGSVQKSFQDAGDRASDSQHAHVTRPRAMTYEEPRSPMREDTERPAPLQVNKTESGSRGHLHLPPGFELDSSEQTNVDTVWHPAVEQETVHIDRTEVVEPMIERDLHLHHYYEYEQPVAVQEVLPMKHYQLNPKTGEKVEIDPPPGWQPPQSLTTSIPDTSQIEGTQRHYVVDSEHPNGKLEDAPYLERQAATTWI